MLPPTSKWMNFKNCFVVYLQAFCETYPLIVVKAINSNSESIANHCSKNLGGGQDKPAGIGCPPGVKISRVGGKISRDSLPPGGKLSRGAR